MNHRGSTEGIYMTRRPAEKIFERISEKTKIKCTPHMLRHTHGTELTEAGYNQLYVSHRLGHASIVTTSKYVHLSLAAQTEAYNRFITNRKSAVLING